MRSQSHSKSQSGSAIFIILIAIVLLAALSMVISDSMRVTGSVENKASKEKLDLQLVQVNQFFESMKVRFTKLTVVDRIPTINISFQNDVYMRVNGTVMCFNNNSNCTSAACHMYTPYSGEGVKPVVFSEVASSGTQVVAINPVKGSMMVGQLGIEGVGTDKPELILRLNGVSPEFCNYFNSKQGITTSFTEPSTLGSTGETALSSRPETWGACVGPAEFNTNNVFGEEATMFRGKTQFCAPFSPASDPTPLDVIYVLEIR